MILHPGHHRPAWHGFLFRPLEVGQGLFRAWSLLRRQGRIGTGVRAIIHNFASEGEAVSAAGGIARRKGRRDHVLLPRLFELRLWAP